MMTLKKYNLVFSTVSVLACLTVSACSLERMGPAAPVTRAGIGTHAMSGYLTVQPGDSLQAIADRYQLKAEDIAVVNKLAKPYSISAGQRLALPYPVTYQIKPQDTLHSIARMFAMTPADLAQYNKMKPTQSLNVGQLLKIPGGGSAKGPVPASGSFTTFTIEDAETLPPQKLPEVEIENLKSSSAAPSAPPTVYAAAPAVKRETPAPVQKSASPRFEANDSDPVAAVLTAMLQQAAAEAAITSSQPKEPEINESVAQVVTPAPEPKKMTLAQVSTQGIQAQPVSWQTTVAPASKRGFSWPVRGKVISSYGAKSGNMFNDGVNIAAPRGTPVQAASDGVVAYVGDNIPSYGNIVLVRHNGGLMTAYAHMNTVTVKKGTPIKRGQAIGTVGSSGKVSNSQLHFEIRQGRKSLDPNKFLGASS